MDRNAHPSVRLRATLLFACCSMLGALSSAAATQPDQAPKKELLLKAPEDWRGERIDLPPPFAPDMKLKGLESIRFAPGMFEADSESFFSYVFVFRFQAQEAAKQEQIERELLAYYRGLGQAVAGSRNLTVDPEQFTLSLKEAAAAENAALPKGRSAYEGDLKWTEPFVTGKQQTLHMDVHSWYDESDKQGYIFVLVSPQDRKAAIWEQMRKIRSDFP